jgi:hypothetical protein
MSTPETAAPPPSADAEAVARAAEDLAERARALLDEAGRAAAERLQQAVEADPERAAAVVRDLPVATRTVELGCADLPAVAAQAAELLAGFRPASAWEAFAPAVGGCWNALAAAVAGLFG